MSEPVWASDAMLLSSEYSRLQRQDVLSLNTCCNEARSIAYIQPSALSDSSLKMVKLLNPSFARAAQYIWHNRSWQ